MRWHQVIINWESRSVRVIESAQQAHHAASIGGAACTVLALPAPDLPLAPPVPIYKPLLDEENLVKDLAKPKLKW